MWKYFQKICVFLVVSFIIKLFCFLLKSNFLIDFLKEDMIIIMITLLAINITTTGILFSRLKELDVFVNANNGFKNIVKALKNAVKEQLVLICLAFIILIIKNSSIIFQSNNLSFFLDTLLIAVFINALYILWDTAGAIFDLYNIKK